MAASRTAMYVALYRALESNIRRREPLFCDPYAVRFLPPKFKLAIAVAHGPMRGALERYSERRAPGARSSAICRTRFLDDVIKKEDPEQLVILGAGFDCRAHRLGLQATVFEVDRAETQAQKRAVMGDAPNVRYVEVDFLRDSVRERLEAAGWSPTKRTTFLWEGVSNYLSEPAVRAVLDLVASAPKGSTIAFTYIHRGVIDGSMFFEGAQQLVESVASIGEPWTFGIVPSELQAFVGKHGLQIEQDLGADEYRALYAWADGLKGYAFYRIAVARVAATAP